MGMLRTVSQQMFKCNAFLMSIPMWGHKMAIGGGRWLPGAAPPFIWKTDWYQNWACSSQAADLSKEWSLSSLPAHSLPSNSVAPHPTANSPPCITVSLAGEKQSTSPYSYSQQGFIQVVVQHPKWGHGVVMIKLPSPQFKKFPVVSPSFFHTYLN